AFQARDAILDVRQLLLPRQQIAIEDVTLALDLDHLVLQLQDPLLRLLLRLLDRRADVAQHEQQHHRAEPASDAVEERDAEDLGFAALCSSSHGTSWPILRGLQELAAGASRCYPEGARRLRLAF